MPDCSLSVLVMPVTETFIFVWCVESFPKKNGFSKKEFFLKETEAANLELMRAVKNSFDPKQLLNRHISYNK